MKFRKKNDEVNISIIDGLTVSNSFYNRNENRILTLVLKGIIVYLVTAGMFGCALTATKTNFNQFVFNAIVLVLAVTVSLFYYNKKSETIGDIIYLIMLIFVGLYFSTYINTGFYTWMNDIIGAASAYFNLPEIGGYVTRNGNVNLAVSMAACYLGAVGVIIVNMSLIKKMHVLDIILDSFIIIILPAYLEMEPSYYYATILIIGISLSFIWRATGRYEKTDNNCVYVKKAKEITYTYNVKAHACAFGQTALVIFAMIALFYVVFPVEDYKIVRTRSEAKEQTDDIFETFITSGISGFFNKYESIGGIKSGRLGGVNSIRLDYQTDLEFTYVPYSFDPVYLRTFVGGEYTPYGNYWTLANGEYLNRYEFDKLKSLYASKAEYSAKGKAVVHNIAAEYGEFALYYAQKHEAIPYNRQIESEYYPMFEGTAIYGDSIHMSETERKYWLQIPDDNRPSIMNFVSKLNINESMDEYEIAQCIKDYYYNNIPYTLRPGATPRNRDFVNYFLDNNKKGYCVHFASAATLAFRQLGIPARYVEGYAFDYLSVMEATVNADAEVDEFYDGYNELGDSALVTVELTDADAHAWVEIYTDDYGWIPVELTPPSSDKEVEKRSFLDRFWDIFRSNQLSGDSIDNADNIKLDTTKLRLFIISLIAVILVAVCVRFFLGTIIEFARYIRADINTKLVYKYHNFYYSNIKKIKGMSDKCNYHDALHYAFDNVVNEKEIDKAVQILEKAGFSNSYISDDEYNYVCKFLKNKVNRR